MLLKLLKKLNLKRYLLAGVVALLPLWATIFILRALFYLVSGGTRPLLYPLFRHIGGREHAVFLLDLASFVLTIAVIWLVGFFASRLFGKELFGKIDDFFRKIPLISDVYLTIRQITTILVPGEGESAKFKRVVLVEYPMDNIYSIGFLTSEAFHEVRGKTGKNLVTVLIPTPPNPVNGLLILVPKEKVISLDLSVDEAIKMIFSLGVIAPPLPLSSPAPLKSGQAPDLDPRSPIKTFGDKLRHSGAGTRGQAI